MTATKNVHKDEVRARKRLPLLRPGTVAIIVGVICVTTWQAFAPGKVKIERRVEPSQNAVAVRKPSASCLTKWSQQLALTDKQKDQLRQLALAEQTELKPLAAELDRAIREFNDFTQHEATNHSIGQIQAAAQPVTQLSHRKRQIVQSYASKACLALTPAQRDRALELWQQETTTQNAAKLEVLSR